MSAERWLPIPGWDGLYEVSDLGRVKSSARRVESYGGRVGVRRERILATSAEATSGHLRVSLRHKNREGRKSITIGVHRLVLLAFVGPCPEGMEACHNNGDPADNRLPNLRWDTRKANVSDTLAHGQHYWAKRTECAKGHPYTPESLHTTPGGHRRCRICVRDWAREMRARTRQAEEVA